MIYCGATGKPFDDLIWHLQAHDPDVPGEILKQYYRDSAIEFLRKSNVMRRWVALDVQSGMAKYPIELEDCWLPNRFYRVLLKTEDCDFQEDYAEPEPYTCGGCMTGSDCVYDICEDSTDCDDCTTEYFSEAGRDCEGNSLPTFSISDRFWMSLDPAPTCDMEKALHAFISIVPSSDTCELPTEIAEEYGTIIASGALSKMLGIKSRPTYDREMSIAHRRDFDAAIINAGRASRVGYSAKPKKCHRGYLR